MSIKDEDKPIEKKFILSSTYPKMPHVEYLSSVSFVPPKGVSGNFKLKKGLIQLQQLTTAIFVKSEIAKYALSRIKIHSSDSLRVTDKGEIGVKSEGLIPIIKEVDSLIFELGSMLEFLSRQVDTVMQLGFEQDSSFYKVKSKMKRDYPTDSLTTKLETFYASSVQNYFRKMRNRITHRLPFELRIYNTNILFPDDPNSDDRYPSVKNKIDVIATCETWIIEILSFINDVTGILIAKISVSESDNE